MNKSRLPLLIIILSLVAAAALAVRTYSQVTGVKAGSGPSFSASGAALTYPRQFPLNIDDARVYDPSMDRITGTNAGGSAETSHFDAEQALFGNCTDQAAGAPAVRQSSGCLAPK